MVGSLICESVRTARPSTLALDSQVELQLSVSTKPATASIMCTHVHAVGGIGSDANHRCATTSSNPIVGHTGLDHHPSPMCVVHRPFKVHRAAGAVSGDKNNQQPFRVRLCTLPVIAARCSSDARLAALGGHEISLVIAIGVYPLRSQAIDQSQRR